MCVAGLLLLAVPLSACSTPTPPPEPVTIRFAYVTGIAGGDVEEYYELLAAEFSEDHPHVTVDVGPVGTFAEYDVIAITEVGLRTVREQGYVCSLDSFIEWDVSFDLGDFYPEVLEIFAHGGEMWGIPFAVDLLVMYYNKDLFDAYGVPYPEEGWTWDDFLDRALALRDREAGIYGYAPWDDYTDAFCRVP